MGDLTDSIQADVEAVSRITIVSSLLDVVCRTTGMGFAAIARVTEERWVACGVRDEISFGIKPGDELKIETTICNEIRQSGEAVVIDNVATDEKFCTHHTPALYGFKSYISIPIIRRNGSFFGTLCAIDPQPARLNTPEIIGMFKMFADLISFHLEAVEKLSVSETSLQEERKTAELREQFIAILGHDLRNPIGAISSSAQLLQQLPLDNNSRGLVNVIRNSSYRVLGLIENMLDFARGRMGSGIFLSNTLHHDMIVVLQQVVSELRMLWPASIIETSFDVAVPVNCDSARIAQLFSNLLGNALSYGNAGVPVKVFAESNQEKFTIAVVNSCAQIPASAMERLFTAFSRAEIKPDQHGLGLGLYISAEIARAHGGKIEVSSTPEQTCFTCTIPVR